MSLSGGLAQLVEQRTLKSVRFQSYLFMNDQQLLRYSSHNLLPDIEYQWQEKLLHSHVNF